MNKLKMYAAFAVLVAMFFGCGSNKQQQNVDQDGFVSLFNGKDLDNWNLKIRSGDSIEAKKVFAIGENNTVHVFRHHPDSFNLNQKGCGTHGLMWTKKSYSKYIFKFEYKWGSKIANNFNQFQYDAGMYYHVYNDKIWPFGIEYQIRYDHTQDKNHTGDYWASSAKLQWYMGADSTSLIPQKGGIAQPIRGGEHLASASANNKVNALNGEWNQCEIIVMADKYSIHKVNGVIVNYATDFDLKEGIIGLQSETAEIFYRNIKIKEFDEVIPAEQFLN